MANADGTDERAVGELGANCCPWAAADGSHLVFSGPSTDGRITAVILNLDGSGAVTLPLPAGTLNLASGPISPDGTRLVREGFDDLQPADGGIYMTDLDGSDVVRITEVRFIPGDFSPDGGALLLFSNEEGSPPPAGSLWIVHVDGTGLRQLTPDATKVQCCFNYRWSPDGTTILFAGPEGALWTIAPDGTNLTQVFKDADGRYAVTPTWSPDGSLIMFALDPTSDPFEHPINGLYVIRADGTGLTLVLGGNDFKREPVWVSG